MFDYQAARDAGYSDSEIAQELSSRYSFDFEAARAAGYTEEEIAQELARKEEEPVTAPDELYAAHEVGAIPEVPEEEDRGAVAKAEEVAPIEQAPVEPPPDPLLPMGSTVDTSAFTPMGEPVDVRTERTAAENEQRPAFIAALPEQVKQSAIESTGGVLRAIGETDVVGAAGNILTKLFPTTTLIPEVFEQAGITLPEIMAFGGVADKGAEIAGEAGQKKQALLQKINNIAPLNEGQKLLLSASESLAIAAPGMLVGPVAGPAPLLAMFGFSEFGRSYQEGRESDLSPDDARKYALRNSVIEVGTELIPATKMFAKGTPAFQRLVGVFGTEMGGESLATIGQDLNTYVSEVGPGMTGQEFVTKLWEDLQTTWATTAVVAPIQASVAHAGMKAVEKIQQITKPTDVFKAKSADEAIDTFTKSVQAPLKGGILGQDGSISLAPEPIETVIEKYGPDSPIANEVQAGTINQLEEDLAAEQSRLNTEELMSDFAEQGEAEIVQDRQKFVDRGILAQARQDVAPEITPEAELPAPIAEPEQIEPAPTIPEKLSAALGKPEQVETLRNGGIVSEEAQIEQIVRDAVTQKIDVAEALEKRGKTEAAAQIRAEAVQNGQVLKAADGQRVDEAVDSALKATPPAVSTEGAGQVEKSAPASLPEDNAAARKPDAVEGYKPAGDKVSGLAVRSDVPNTDSIQASLNDYTVQKGVREIPIAAFPGAAAENMFYAADDHRRVDQLAGEIKESGEINPLIVVIDKDGPYVLEGGHRLAALHKLGVSHVPAMVVVDNDSVSEQPPPAASLPGPTKGEEKSSPDVSQGEKVAEPTTADLPSVGTVTESSTKAAPAFTLEDAGNGTYIVKVGKKYIRHENGRYVLGPKQTAQKLTRYYAEQVHRLYSEQEPVNQQSTNKPKAVPAVEPKQAESPAPESTKFPIAPHGKNIIVTGDPAAIRSKLAESGIKAKGTVSKKGGGVVFAAGMERELRAALEKEVLDDSVQRDSNRVDSLEETATTSKVQEESEAVGEKEKGGTEVETDPARVQEIKNSITEGEGILTSGEFNGQKKSRDYLESVRRSVNNSRAKIGLGPTEVEVKAKDRRKYDESGKRVDRRKDSAARKRIDEMTPEEMRRELLTNPVTGIPNARAFAEAEAVEQKYKAFLDVDSLKYINDNLGGHEAGDKLLQAVADAVSQVTKEGYHKSGDEFLIRADTPEQAEALAKQVNEILADVELEFIGESGKTYIYKGPGISYGIGKTTEEADALQLESKRARTAAGLRAERGERPSGLREQDTGTDSGGKVEAVKTKLRTKAPYLGDDLIDEISKAILDGDAEQVATFTDQNHVMDMVSDMITAGLVEQSFQHEYYTARAIKVRGDRFTEVIEEETNRRVSDLLPENLDVLKKNPDYINISEWLLGQDITDNFRTAIVEDIKAVKKSLEPKVIKEFKDYVLAEVAAGYGWQVDPGAKIHLVTIDEGTGPNKQKVANVQTIVEAAIKRQPDNLDIPAVRFVLPSGAQFLISNTQKDLRKFKALVPKVYTPVGKPPKAFTKPGTAPQARKQIDWADKMMVLKGTDWVSDGTMLVKGYKPKSKGEVEDVPETAFLNFEKMLQSASPAEIRYYSTGLESETLGVGKTPVLQDKNDVYPASAIILDTFTNKRHVFSQGKLNIIESVYPDVEYSITADGVLFGTNDGEMVAVVVPFKPEDTLPNEEMAKSAGYYSIGQFADIPVIMEMPEVVEMATELMNGKRPQLVKHFRKEGVRGQFLARGDGNIKILRTLGADFNQALKTIAHEIGHLVDYLDEKTMSRGNILGRIASLKGYMKHYLAESPDAPGPLTNADRNRLMKEARMLMKRDAQTLIDEVITKELPVTPEDVLAVLKGIEKDPEPAPEVVLFIFTASTAVKKSIALQAMKGLSPKEMEHLKSYVTEKTGKQIAKDEPTRKEIYQKFKELVKEEIAKRNLLSKELITEELKTFTQLWRPFDPWADRVYTKYRHSSKELYADAVSGLITNPAMVQRVAPTFWKGFLNYIESKPDVKRVWGEILDRIGRGPVEVSMRRVEDDYRMFTEGHAARAERAKPKPIKGAIDTLRIWLDDKNHPINKELRALEKEGGAKAQAASDARAQIKEIPYITSEIDDFMFDFNRMVQRPADEAGITLDDIGVVALRKHIIANRTDIFSTKGYTPETAQADLNVLKAQWGDEKFNKTVELLDALREVRNDHIYPIMEDSGLYSPELAQYMNETTDYTKVSVLHYLEEQYGKGTGARIYKQVGTLSDIENPIVATILQDMSIVRAARINETKRAIAPLLMDAGVFEPAQMAWDKNLNKRVPKDPKDPEMALFTVMVEGKPQHFYAPKTITEAFEYRPVEANAVARVWSYLTRPVRELLISKNPVWMARNPMRDFRETVKKNPEIKLRHTPKLLMEYIRATREVFAEAWRTERSQTIHHLMRNRALAEDRVYDGLDYDMESEIHRLQNTFKLSTAADKDRGMFLRAWTALNRNANNFGRAMEIVSKVAGYKYLKANTTLSDKEILARVRGGRIGTPDFKTKGSMHALTNSLFMFSNIGKEGVKTNIKAAMQQPKDYIWKTLWMNVMPKVILGTLAAGYFFGDDDDEKELNPSVAKMVAGDRMQRIIAGISEYDISHYTIVPLGLTDEGKSIYLRIPEDYEGQAIGAIAWKLMHGNFTGHGSAVAETWNMQPYAVHPILKIGMNLIDYYARGINPIDDYRGRPILSDEAMKVGGTKAAGEIAKASWREIGGATFYNPAYSEIEEKRTGLEAVLNTFPGNIIGTFVKISDRGIHEKITAEFAEIDRRKAKESIAVDKALAKMSNEEKLMVAEVAPKLRQRIKKQLLMAENTAYSKALAQANTKEKLAIVIEVMQADIARKED